MNKKIPLISIFLFIIALLFRLKTDYPAPFWVDEYSSASQARLIGEILSNNENAKFYSLEPNNYLTHLIIALFFNLFSESVLIAKIPFMIIGSLVPVAILWLGKKIFNIKSGLISATLAIFHYFLITWSQQVRGYVIQQLFLILVIGIYWNIINKKNHSKKQYYLFIIFSFLGILTHLSFAIYLFPIFLHFIILNKKQIIDRIKKHWKFLLIIPVLVVFFIYKFKDVIFFITERLSLVNNLNYYHSFLWRENTAIILLFSIGFLFSIFTKSFKKNIALSLVLGTSIIFFGFLFPPYVSRYLLPIFPIILLYSGFGILKISTAINKDYTNILATTLTLFLIFNGNNFTIKPKPFYSVNHQMREIALIDYDSIYSKIKSISIGNKQIAIVDTWPDRTKWYLGENINNNFYVFRWLNDVGTVNGLTKRTDFILNKNQEKVIEQTGKNPIKLIGELNDLLKVLEKYPQGFIWIDDTSLPNDVIQYVENNFHKELVIDHFYLDDNPYSLWPGTLYSWGINN